MMPSPADYRYVLARVGTSDLAGGMASVQDVWSRFSSWPLTYSFLDEDFDALYRAEQRIGWMMTAFGALAILIACLGLFGLASFVTQQRTKEVGVRKVLGATVTSLVGLLSKDFLKLVLVSFVIAMPAAYFAMTWWLDDFAYRIALEPGLFLLAGLLALGAALLTVGYQAVRAALANPVEALRYE